MNIKPEKQIEILREFMLPARVERLEEVLSQRTQYLTVILENIYHPQNASAVLRTCECFGIQDLHVIADKKKYRPNPDVVRGAAKWITVHRYNNTEECMNTLKKQGYDIAITALTGDKLIPLEELPLTSPLALCFGTEDMGVSEEAEKFADYRVNIPMAGFTESFNISVAAAISLYSTTTRLRNTPELREKIKLNKTLTDKLRLDWHKKCCNNSNRILMHREKTGETT